MKNKETNKEYRVLLFNVNNELVFDETVVGLSPKSALHDVICKITDLPKTGVYAPKYLKYDGIVRKTNEINARVLDINEKEKWFYVYTLGYDWVLPLRFAKLQEVEERDCLT